MEWEVILDDLIRSGIDRTDRDGQLKALRTLEGIVDELPNTSSPVPLAFYTEGVLSGLVGLFGDDVGDVAAGIIVKIPDIQHHLAVVVDVVLVGWGDGDGSSPMFSSAKGGAAARRTRITHCTFRVFSGLYPGDEERIERALTLIVPRLHRHEKMHVWEEAIKFVTHGLMVAAGKDTPLSILKLQPFFELIVPRLADPRPRVQFALIECLAVLNHIYSERTIVPLLADLPRDGRKDLHEMILERFRDSNLPIAGEGGVLIQPVLGMVSAEERINLWLPDPQPGGPQVPLTSPPSAECSSLWSGGGRSTPGQYTRSRGGQTSSSLSSRVGFNRRTPSVGHGDTPSRDAAHDELMELQSVGSLASRGCGSPPSKAAMSQGSHSTSRRWDGVQPLSRDVVSSHSTVEPTLSSAGSLIDTFSSGSDALSLLRIKGRRARNSFHDPSTPSVVSVASSSTAGLVQSAHGPIPWGAPSPMSVSPAQPRGVHGLPPPVPVPVLQQPVNQTNFAYASLPDRGNDPLSGHGALVRGAAVGSNVVRLMKRASTGADREPPPPDSTPPQPAHSRQLTSAIRMPVPTNERVLPTAAQPNDMHSGAPPRSDAVPAITATAPASGKPVKGVVFNLNLSFKPAPQSTSSSQHPTSVYRGPVRSTDTAPVDAAQDSPVACGPVTSPTGCAPRLESRSASSTGGGFTTGCQQSPTVPCSSPLGSATLRADGDVRSSREWDTQAVEQANFDFTSLPSRGCDPLSGSHARDGDNSRASFRIKRSVGRGGTHAANPVGHKPQVQGRTGHAGHEAQVVALKGVDLGMGVLEGGEGGAVPRERGGQGVDAGQAQASLGSSGGVGRAGQSGPLPVDAEGSSRKWKGLTEQGSSPLDEIDSDNLMPVEQPEQACGDALHALKSNDDWKKTFESLNVLRALAVHHTQVLAPHMQTVTQVLTICSDNLRSAISKNAIVAFADIISAMRRGCDKHLADIVAQLIRKAADSNHFLVDQAERGLTLAIAHCGPNRMLNALLTAAGHKAVKQRAKATKFLHAACAKMKVSAYASRDMPRLLQLLHKTMGEGNFEIRHWGRQCLAALYTNEPAPGEFERYCGAKGAKMCPKQIAKMMDATIKAAQSYRVDQISDGTTESSSFNGTHDGKEIGVLGASIGAAG